MAVPSVLGMKTKHHLQESTVYRAAGGWRGRQINVNKHTAYHTSEYTIFKKLLGQF